jgi:outer membrane protein insertion porin family
MYKKLNSHIVVISFTLLLALLSGCTGLKGVSEGKHLYSGHEILIDSTQFLADPKVAKSEIEGLITLQPNRKVLWMRPFLSLYYLVSEPKKDSGFRHWLKYKMGEPPSIIEDINLQNTVAAIENRLQNRGNFQAKSSYEVVSDAKTAKVKFIISPGKPYRIKAVKFPAGNSQVEVDISNQQASSVLKPGEIYNLKDFEKERNRIDGILKDKGYFYFKAEYLLFTADTALSSHQINTWLNIKPSIPPEAFTAFRLNNIYVFDDFSLGDYHPDTVHIGNYYYVSQKHEFNPQTILNAVFFAKDSLYSRTDHYNTLRHLMGIGIYKYANARFTADNSLPGRMNVNLLLTPVRKISLSAEMNAAIKTNNFAGPGLKLNYKNRNTFKGAELLSVTLGGSFETQISGAARGQTSYQIALDASLTLPKFIPFKLQNKTSKSFVPKTIFTSGGGLFSRVNLYELHSFNASIGYSWKSSEKITHLFRPIDISYTNLVKSSAEFEQYLQENPTVRKSFEEQFIMGGSYEFVNSNFYFNSNKFSFTLIESIDLAGNITSLFTTAIHGSPASAESPNKPLGLPYSQFARLRSEFRYFYTPNNKSQFGWRLIAAAALPYGNSTTVPYVKQYYVGGTNSIRSFVARSIGPGTSKSPDSLSSIYVDQAGDIKLESSIEYRFNIYKYFKGALYADAGNIWLVNDDPQRAGGKFNINTFYKEIAVGSGLGFRFDFTIIIIRLDVAFPLRKPYLTEGERWVFKQIDLGSQPWRHDNIMWNIAIGYPF